MLEMDPVQPLGVLGCRKLCEDRRPCVDVTFSPTTMSCTLIFNSSSTNQEPGSRVCVHRSVHTRSGRPVDVLGKCKGKVEAATSDTYEAIKLTFTPSPNRDVCKQDKQPKSIIQSTRLSSTKECHVASVQTFLEDGFYTWQLSAIDSPMAHSCSGQALFRIQSSRYYSLYFDFALTKFRGKFRVKMKNKRINLGPKEARLGVMLGGDVLRVVDLKTNISLSANKSEASAFGKYRLHFQYSCIVVTFH